MYVQHDTPTRSVQELCKYISGDHQPLDTLCRTVDRSVKCQPLLQISVRHCGTSESSTA